MTHIFDQKNKRGFTLIELLIALTIVAIIIVLMMLGQGLQLSRGEDARRKSDLAKLKVSFEDYYNDHSCYPPPALLQRCGSSDLAPYVAKIPCDPRTKDPYPYYMSTTCDWFALFTTLGDTKDPVIPTLGCFPTCGVPGKPYNYIQTNGAITPAQTAGEIGAGNAVTGNSGASSPTPIPTATPVTTQTPTPSGSPSSTSTPVPTPTPTPTPTPINALACDPSGQCNVYQDPITSGCPVTFTDAIACQQACANPANRCAQ